MDAFPFSLPGFSCGSLLNTNAVQAAHLVQAMAESGWAVATSPETLICR
jgi:hypothetical protein